MKICYTDSVDTSAELLAQALDIPEENWTKSPLSSDVQDVLFYGIVKIPENVGVGGKVINDPRKGRKTLAKSTILNVLDENGIPVIKYTAVKDRSFSDLKKKVGDNKIALVSKQFGMKSVGTAANSGEFAEKTAGGHVQYVRKCYPNCEGRYRVFVGSDQGKGVIGALVSELRELSFKETCIKDKGEEARGAIVELFANGILSENMGEGITAWSEEEFCNAADLPDTLVSRAKKVLSVLGLDFVGVDFMKIKNGAVYSYSVSNVTTSPSLQNDKVLHGVAEHFSYMISGKPISRKEIIKMIDNIPDEHMNTIASFFKKEFEA